MQPDSLGGPLVPLKTARSEPLRYSVPRSDGAFYGGLTYGGLYFSNL